MTHETGHALWALLHAYAYHYPARPDRSRQIAAQAWLADFTVQVRKLSAACKCSDHWGRLNETAPPPVEDGPAFYWWTVAVHDAVNARLLKPLHAPDYSIPFWAARGLALFPS